MKKIIVIALGALLALNVSAEDKPAKSGAKKPNPAYKQLMEDLPVGLDRMCLLNLTNIFKVKPG